jgi:hypothetical protein
VDGGDLGGTMRLGAYDATLTRGSRVARIYGSAEISERHRHRYEVNTTYKGRLEQHGMRLSGMSPDGILPDTEKFGERAGTRTRGHLIKRSSSPGKSHMLFEAIVPTLCPKGEYQSTRQSIAFLRGLTLAKRPAWNTLQRRPVAPRAYLNASGQATKTRRVVPVRMADVNLPPEAPPLWKGIWPYKTRTTRRPRA